MAGEFDAAINLIEHYMSVPFSIESDETLRNMPWWDLLRSNPRFKTLVENIRRKNITDLEYQ
jgi:hypothetical protein